MITYNKTVWIKTDFIGFHCWPEAPDEVAYLRSLHRHQFNVRVSVFVTDSNREVEFHLLKKLVNEVVQDEVLPRLAEKPHYSCEMIAELIGTHLAQTHALAVSAISVDEDGECGTVIFPKSEEQQ